MTIKRATAIGSLILILGAVVSGAWAFAGDIRISIVTKSDLNQVRQLARNELNEVRELTLNELELLIERIDTQERIIASNSRRLDSDRYFFLVDKADKGPGLTPDEQIEICELARRLGFARIGCR